MLSDGEKIQEDLMAVTAVKVLCLKYHWIGLNSEVSIYRLYKSGVLAY